MSESTESVKKQSLPIIEQRHTLVRRVSDMFRDGKSSGPPLLFRHASMQRLRHCCQNLNLFPYLLYSFGNSKSHPTVKKLHRNFILLMHTLSIIIQSMLNSILQSTPVKNSVRFAIGFQRVLLKHLHTQGSTRSSEAFASLRRTSKSPQTTQEIKNEEEEKFAKFKPRERKRISLVLTLAVYFALLVLASQLVGIISVMLVGKYPPGFIFLMLALLFLGYITLKIMAFDKGGHGFKEQKRKAE
ncbi:uncharacterized protein [Neodiprion pinetum]|uniref:Uncharacterized protein LOC107225357 n=1 Tax=Neodiprion lecontei TaxID=441921 RepID=A0A6J0C423_NEOLC|nr:uncharacterized protein LOC107225357 [Neodiprion lecontei]XP_015521278.1 uncharacterized protein LOC107225357 [Neodiprion lecontei]XP_046430484.1 uncharacterized protein LOC124184614 [Neodiprion fabricii]XP_046430485.1 uncharacterized protein LOC124184614 [Neodiprion fabricii]XP_046487188.1 uncharacterized protein LOC124221335 [Neodiprion pinetum]XP_046487189.1 uncharacterized protein LOC124221335 [Neodiprion pinetum]XP_046624121.1 uncharacterized protein LOC124306955 [Neodiprion virginian